MRENQKRLWHPASNSWVPWKAVFISFQDLLPRLRSYKYDLIFHFVQIIKRLTLKIESPGVTLHLTSFSSSQNTLLLIRILFTKIHSKRIKVQSCSYGCFTTRWPVIGETTQWYRGLFFLSGMRRKDKFLETWKGWLWEYWCLAFWINFNCVSHHPDQCSDVTSLISYVLPLKAKNNLKSPWYKAVTIQINMNNLLLCFSQGSVHNFNPVVPPPYNNISRAWPLWTLLFFPKLQLYLIH